MRMTEKRLQALHGQPVRLLPKAQDDWAVAGILTGHSGKFYTVETRLDGVWRTIDEPRDEFAGVEEIDQEAQQFRRGRQ